MTAKAWIATAVLGVAVAGGSMVSALQPAAGRLIELTADDTMKFSKTMIEAKPGEMLKVQLVNKGTLPKMVMGHNFVVLKKATDITAFTTAAIMAASTDYIPAKFKANVIAATATSGPGETVSVSFKAPAAGTYDFICSFPGHFATMKGTLVVK